MSKANRLLKNLFFSLAPADRNQKRNNFHGHFERFEAISEMMGVFEQPINLPDPPGLLSRGITRAYHEKSFEQDRHDQTLITE